MDVRDGCWVGMVGWSSTPLAEGVVMGTFGFARAIEHPHEFLVVLGRLLLQ